MDSMTTSLKLVNEAADGVTIEARTEAVVHLFKFESSNDGWRLTEVTTLCSDGLGVADIRSTPLSLARAYLREQHPEAASAVMHPSRPGSASTTKPVVSEYDALRGRIPQRRERWSEVELAELAARYVDLVSDGLGRPTARLANEYATDLGTTSFSSGRMRALLAEARQTGLLTRTKGNKAGGRLTAKAERLLSEEES
jgi:hypothetical protein